MTALAQQFDALLFDLDGVVYIGPHAVPHAAEAIAQARDRGVRCAFITNNAARTPQVVAEHLTGIGVACTIDEVVTSPQAAVTVLGEFVPPGSRVLVTGGDGIADELRSRGYVPVRTLAEQPAAVMQGFSPDLGWRDLAEACFAVRAGLPWIATNLDRTFPTPGGAAPGNGSLVGVVAATVGRRPDAVAGKPEPPLLHEAIGRLGARHPLMVGDRLDTDIEAGARIQIPTLLVMTGITTVEEVLGAGAHERPTYLGLDLRVLAEPYTAPVVDGTGASARCGGSVVALRHGELTVPEPGDRMEMLRAAAALAWAIADAGAARPDTGGVRQAWGAT